MKIKKLTDRYFKEFSKKNITGLENLFSKNIVVRDWEKLVNGKKNVINFNKEISAKFPNIKIKMLNYFLNAKKKIISCEILVCLDKRSTIKVVDIIFFDKNWKIKKIYAFKG